MASQYSLDNAQDPIPGKDFLADETSFVYSLRSVSPKSENSKTWIVSMSTAVKRLTYPYITTHPEIADGAPGLPSALLQDTIKWEWMSMKF